LGGEWWGKNGGKVLKEFKISIKEKNSLLKKEQESGGLYITGGVYREEKTGESF